MKEQQARSDERDDSRHAFTWGIPAVVVVLLGALAYFHALQQRFEVPIEMPPAQSAPGGEVPAAPSNK
ncbi:hypothetical protein EJP69_28865 [Variovorax gossypii]|uniref:Uncharacterized protein n=1 Tax=Variovorax gossypii TaxID=1679495 RepID=A0A3S0Q6C2_9BURK|nr:hypothetical protein [Variovorax gossypii]RTQ30691.1 hypothetical protein EJP69_28865 [Variovorax gossypii]